MHCRLGFAFSSALFTALMIPGLSWGQGGRGYQASVTVAAPTRLDTVFPMATQSLETPPADWYQGYDSTAQKYERYVPMNLDAKKTYPVILFIPAGNTPAGWNQWKTVCEQQQIIFASPFEAGNNTPMPRRIRIVLDVLDDLRKQFPVDPDRTYVSGFSGGARVACGLTFALPELFGGMMPICASEDLREEPWLRHRAQERLSVALVTGENDFNRGESERFRGPLFTEVGIRTKVWVVPGLGHGIPDATTLGEAFRWLDQAAADRRKLATKYPAMRRAANANPSREEEAAALLSEGQKRIQQKPTLYSGLMLMMGVLNRWPNTEAGESAKAQLTAYEAKGDKSWEVEDVAEQRKFLAAEAHGLTAYATGPLPNQYEKMRSNIAEGALERWRAILADAPSTPLGKEATQKIPELEKLVEKK